MPKTTPEPMVFRKRRRGIAKTAEQKNLGETALPLRVINSLENSGCLTILQLSKKTIVELRQLPNFGRRTIEQLIEVVRIAKLRVPRDWLEMVRDMKEQKRPDNPSLRSIRNSERDDPF